MRRFVSFTLCVILLFFFTKADNSTPDASTSYRLFVEDSKSWVVTLSTCHGMMPVFQTETYIIDGDTVISNQLWKKLTCRTINGAESTTALCALLCEDNNRVMCITKEGILAFSPTPAPLYDFNSVQGDTLSLLTGLIEDSLSLCYHIWSDFVFENENGLFHGQLATTIDVDTSDIDENTYFPLYKWYEGIGSRMHPFKKISWNKHMGGMLYLLRECRVGNRIVYQNWEDGIMFPDFTGDGRIDISDVNAVINSMLEKSQDVGEMPDATGDRIVDIADINAIINVMLRKRVN